MIFAVHEVQYWRKSRRNYDKNYKYSQIHGISCESDGNHSPPPPQNLLKMAYEYISMTKKNIYFVQKQEELNEATLDNCF